MIFVGYCLVDPKGQIVQTFPIFPIENGRPVLSASYEINGASVTIMSPVPGETLPGGFRLIEKFLDDGGYPSEFHSFADSAPVLTGDRVVVTRKYSDTPDIVPPVVTMAQCRLALSQIGRHAEADAMVMASDNERLKILWQFSKDVRRDAPELLFMAKAMSLTESQVDDLFRLAKSL